MFFAIVSILGIASSLAVISHSLRNAPEGYQDERGFHFARPKKPAGAILSRRPQANTDAGVDLRLRPAVGQAKG